MTDDLTHALAARLDVSLDLAHAVLGELAALGILRTRVLTMHEDDLRAVALRLMEGRRYCAFEPRRGAYCMHMHRSRDVAAKCVERHGQGWELVSVYRGGRHET